MCWACPVACGLVGWVRKRSITNWPLFSTLYSSVNHHICHCQGDDCSRVLTPQLLNPSFSSLSLSLSLYLSWKPKHREGTVDGGESVEGDRILVLY